MRTILTGAATLAALLAMPAIAQDVAAPGSVGTTGQGAVPEQIDAGVLDGDFLVIGAGVGYTPTYEGADDYTVTPFPAVAGRVGGIGIAPRAGGLALDLIADYDTAGNVQFQLGPVARLRFGRDGDTGDDVVNLLDDQDLAVEVGANAGITFAQVLHPYDRLTVSTDVRWDVAGAHDGMVVTPGVSYLTPLSRGIFAALNVNAEWVDDSFAEYYYGLDAQQAAITGLPRYDADGGFKSAGVNLIAGFDLNGDITDGGLSIVGLASYNRLFGSAEDTPFTSIRGSADQWVGGIGLAYTF
ncbi:MipA/OmpV family protein [Croceibacterium sp. TMG7-5b_MA50]|uniref:MipA/OmpV family protein n=1 Tax=Croceibacterium sp. TMG7-5b_MA50 TaxID=3121290 RepID=UPI003221B9BB